MSFLVCDFRCDVQVRSNSSLVSPSECIFLMLRFSKVSEFGHRKLPALNFKQQNIFCLQISMQLSQLMNALEPLENILQ